jgi:hypothetical protein
MKLNKQSTLGKIITDINCPTNSLEIQNEQTCVCTMKRNILSKIMGPMILGSTREEVLDHCKICKMKNINNIIIPKTIETIVLKTDEEQSLKCPMLKGESVSIDKCMSCQHINKKKLKEWIADKGEDWEVKEIPCVFPNVTPESMKVKFDKKNMATWKKQLAKFVGEKKTS